MADSESSSFADAHTMHAVYYEHLGPSNEVVHLGEQPAPTAVPSPNWILVRVHAASSNPVDYKIMKGDMKTVNLPEKFPHIPGFDFSGVIEQVGKNVKGYSVGDEVFGTNDKTNGCMAELVLTRPEWIARKPKMLTHVEAAGVPLAGLTALQALVTRLELEKGDGVIILGGSGAVGQFAIQIAKALGAARVATTSTNEDLCRSLGADTVINYREHDWLEVLQKQTEDVHNIVVEKEGDAKHQEEGEHHKVEVEKKPLYTHVFDCVGGEAEWERAERAKKLIDVSKYCTIVGDRESELDVGRIVGIVANVVGRNIKSLFNLNPTYSFLKTNFEVEGNLQSLATMIEEGKVKVVLDPSSPYHMTEESVKELFAKQESHRAKGKLVLSLEGVEKLPKTGKVAGVRHTMREEKKSFEEAHKEHGDHKKHKEDHEEHKEHDAHHKEEEGSVEKKEVEKEKEEELVVKKDTEPAKQEEVMIITTTETTTSVSEPEKEDSGEKHEEKEEVKERDEDKKADVEESETDKTLKELEKQAREEGDAMVIHTSVGEPVVHEKRAENVEEE